MTEITMPKLSDTMTEGRLVSWKKSVGDRVERGEIIAEVETDKANMELEAFTSGVLLETKVKSGELVAVGTVIGVIGAAGESAVAPPASTPSPVEPTPAHLSPSFRENISQAGLHPEHLSMAPVEEHHEGRAAPAVRRRAREMGVELGLVPGSGPDGRVLMEDVIRFSQITPVSPGRSAGASTTTGTEDSPPEAPSLSLSSGEQPLTRMRAAIARTVTESWRTVPHFYVTVDVIMDEALEVRRELKEGGMQVSLNDFIVKAAALALVKYPSANASFAGDRIATHGEINIGIAVSLPEGLLVPVLRGCTALSLREIASESRRLIDRARCGMLSETDLAGGTFTVSNLGMYGVTGFAAVILPPQAAILAAGAVLEVVVPRKGAPTVARIMKLTISADHRVLDGVSASGFLMCIKGLLESPVQLLV
jgi:pyruvate dehydrogenase E2 component (dihydrolipoyllysine-residue acetyltransferase)